MNCTKRYLKSLKYKKSALCFKEFNSYAVAINGYILIYSHAAVMLVLCMHVFGPIGQNNTFEDVLTLGS